MPWKARKFNYKASKIASVQQHMMRIKRVGTIKQDVVAEKAFQLQHICCKGAVSDRRRKKVKG